jgi:hypothetical protein
MTHKKLLNQFFKENGVKSEVPSPAAMANFMIKIMIEPDVNKKVQGVMNEIVLTDQPEREKESLNEKIEIESADLEQIIKFMRRGIDPVNKDTLVYRALAFEVEIIPRIIEMMKKSLNTSFIENATVILALCKSDISAELFECCKIARSPYGQSMLLVSLGFKGGEEHIPWLIKKHKELKRLYKDESYCDGAFYALDEIERRLLRSGEGR